MIDTASVSHDAFWQGFTLALGVGLLAALIMWGVQKVADIWKSAVTR